MVLFVDDVCNVVFAVCSGSFGVSIERVNFADRGNERDTCGDSVVSCKRSSSSKRRDCMSVVTPCSILE